MPFSTRMISALAICAVLIGCSSTPPAGQDSPEAEGSTQQEDSHDLDALHPVMQKTILAWYNAEDHGGEVGTLKVIGPEGDDLATATTELIHLELLERRVDLDDPENHCYEGIVYLAVEDAQVSSAGRYGKDCCPGVQCEMGPENWMGRLFDHGRDGDVEGVRSLIHPDQGLSIKESWSDRDEMESSGSEEHHLQADEFPGEEGEEFLSCGVNFMPGFSFSCQDRDEGFRCSCHVPGIVTEFEWQWIGEEAYLVEISRAWHE